MKKILLLGGSKFLIPVIEEIHKQGHYAITCDFLPDSIAHKYSDEYQNVSVIDKEAVLDLAKGLNIDGIMSFSCDAGVVTAAYVAEKLGLPFQCSYESACILQNKGLFRKFLYENGFNCPYAQSYVDPQKAYEDIDNFNLPVIVKPADSAGSKGVTKVDNKEQLKEAAEYALSYSISKSFIVEEFIEKMGFSSDTDCFAIDGRLAFCSFNNQYFDDSTANIYTPAAFSWPSYMPNDIQTQLRSELQRLFGLLNIKNSVFNVETRQGQDGKPYIMEVTPRGGGNRLCEMLKYASGTDLIKNVVKSALGEPLEGIDGDPKYNGAWAEVILHSNSDGVFKYLQMADEFKNNFVVEEDLWVRSGDAVSRFTGANQTIGTVVLKFKDHDELKKYMNNIFEHIKVIVE